MKLIGHIIIPNVYSLYPDTMQIYYKQSCFDIFLDPIRFGDVGQKSPGKKFPQNNRQRKFTKDLLRFGSGRDQTTVLVEGYPVWRCSILLHPSCVHIYVHLWLCLTCLLGYCEKSKKAFTLQLYQQSVWEPDMLKVTQSPLPSIDPILLQYSSSDPVPQTGLTTGYNPPDENTTNFVNKQL